MIKEVNVDGEPYPVMMYKPFIYNSIVNCSDHFTIFGPYNNVKIIEKKVNDIEYTKIGALPRRK